MPVLVRVVRDEGLKLYDPDRAEWLDGRSVVFGKLVVGYDLLHKTANKYV